MPAPHPSAGQPNARPHVAVVGGGIAGLAAAYELSRAAPAPRITLLEAEDRLGGKIATERTQGFVIEGGPDCFLAAKPGALELCRELHLEDRLRGTNPARRRSFIKRDEVLHPLPEGLSGLVPSRLLPLMTTSMLSWRGRLRAGLELLVPARRDRGDESIRDFTTRRFGAEAYHWLVEPLLGGIFAGDGGQLSLAATFPHLAEMERRHGGMLRAMVKARLSRTAGGGSSGRTGFLTPAGGLQEIVEAIEARLPDGTIRCGARVTALRSAERGYEMSIDGGETLSADAVIVATPAFVTAPLVRPLDDPLADTLDEIPFVTTATITLGYRARDLPRPLDGYGYVSPRAEGGPVVACSWTSSKFPGRAPDDAALLRLFVGRAGFEEVVDRPDDELLALARKEVRTVLGVRAEPTLVRIARWPRGMPQYTLGHLERIRRIDRRLEGLAGLYLAGASYGGVGIPDCIKSGREAAHSALVDLRTTEGD